MNELQVEKRLNPSRVSVPLCVPVPTFLSWINERIEHRMLVTTADIPQ
jgi:hypothetical protein